MKKTWSKRCKWASKSASLIVSQYSPPCVFTSVSVRRQAWAPPLTCRRFAPKSTSYAYMRVEGKYVSPSFQGWRDGISSMGGTSAIFPSLGNGSETHQPHVQIGFEPPAIFPGSFKRNNTHGQMGYDSPPAAWRGGGTGRGRAQTGRAGQQTQPGPGRGTGAICCFCSCSGFPADHSYRTCPHNACHKCGQFGHVKMICPN